MLSQEPGYANVDVEINELVGVRGRFDGYLLCVRVKQVTAFKERRKYDDT